MEDLDTDSATHLWQRVISFRFESCLVIVSHTRRIASLVVWQDRFLGEAYASLISDLRVDQTDNDAQVL